MASSTKADPWTAPFTALKYEELGLLISASVSDPHPVGCGTLRVPVKDCAGQYRQSCYSIQLSSTIM